MKHSIFLLFSIVFLFYGCKKENENYIERIEFIRSYDGPAPDRIVFSLKTSDSVYNFLCEDSIKRRVFEFKKNQFIDYSNKYFSMDKKENNIIDFYFATTYFLMNEDKFESISDTFLSRKFNTSKDLELKLYTNNKIFEFKNK